MASHVEISKSRTISRPELIQFSHEWVIHDFFSLSMNKPHHLGKISSKHVDIGDEWELTLKIIFSMNDTYLNLTLTLMRCLKQKISADCSFTTSDGSLIRKSKNSNREKSFCQDYGVYHIPVDWKIKTDELFMRTSTSSLSVICNIIISVNPGEFNSYEVEEEIPISHPLRSGLVNDMESLLKNEEFADFTFKFGDKQLQAMKGILSARSTVFATMFSANDWKENQNNSVDIEDIEFEVFREMLVYIYTDKVPQLEKMGKELLAAADKYQLELLRKMCEKTLSKNISHDSVLETYILSDRYRSELLKIRSLQYIRMHLKEIMKSDKFKSLFDLDSDKAMKIIQEALVDPNESQPEPQTQT